MKQPLKPKYRLIQHRSPLKFSPRTKAVRSWHLAQKKRAISRTVIRPVP